jgi:hypothetical protein
MDVTDEAKPHSPVDPEATKAPLGSEALERDRDADAGTEAEDPRGDQQAAVERGLTRIPPG